MPGCGRLILVVLAMLLVARPARADDGAPGTVSCDQAIALADAGRGFPPGLLHAIGVVESGRRDRLSGALTPWPWTVDVEGEGHFYDTEAQAIAAVRSFQAEGRRSIDVGCMQVNLMHHPDAFANLEAAFDPVSNARYAASFLASLRAGAPTWMAAAGMYHSATEALAAPYRARVAAVLGGMPAGAMPMPMPMLAMAEPVAAFGRTAAPRMTIMRPPPPRTGMIVNGRAVGGVMSGRTLATYRAAPVMRRY